MPHRPNPIPRYNGSNQSQLYPTPNETTAPGVRREKDGLPPRHRATSWTSQEAPATAGPSISGTSTPTAVTASATGGGRPSGRALPPPRFQRKQRPPRVQQALAAANASSSTTASSTSQPTSRRTGANAASTTGHGRAGTLTLGPANNWGAGTSAVVSLSMATINAASARASVVHPPAHSVPSFNPHEYDAQETHSMDRSVPLDALSNNSPYELEGLDPVQLHNRITFGMGRSSNAIRNDLYTSDYIQHQTYPTVPGLAPDVDTYSSLSSGRDPAATVRARSQSHHAAHGPALYHPINVAQGARAYSPAYSPIHPSSPYASSFGLDTPPMLHAAPPRPVPDYDHQLRIRSQSLMAPVDAYRATRDSVGVFPPLPSHSTFPNQSMQFDPTPMMAIQPQLALNTDIDDGAHPNSPPHSASSTRKPLKSALKVRRSAPELVDGTSGPPGSPTPPVPPMPRSDEDHGETRRANPLPDPDFTLPDLLQAQYAHQLRLLQEEYASKAAKAEKSRQKSLERTRAASIKRTGGGDEAVVEEEAAAQELTIPRGRTVNLETPPSSGGGSGQRVAFFEKVQVIHQPKDGGPLRAGEEQDAGYLSWDEEWTGDDAEPDEEFVYAPSSAAEGAVLKQGENDTDDSPATDTSDFDGGSDVGDRGHDDAPHETVEASFARNTLLGPESPTTQRSMPDLGSPIESAISPVRAVIHGHEPSPVSGPMESISSGGANGAALEGTSLLPLVEVIAPTPTMPSKELEITEDFPRFDEMDKEDGFTGDAVAVPPMSSTDSTESSDSNSTLRTVALASAAPVEVSPVDEEPAFEAMLSAQTEQDASPLGQTSTPRAAVEEQDPVTLPQLPRTLQRLAHRISRGTSVPPPSTRHVPTIAPPVSGLTLGEYRASLNANAFPDTLSSFDDDESLRRFSSMTSLSSSSSGHMLAFPRPPQSFSTHAGSSMEDILPIRPSPRNRMDSAPRSLYNQPSTRPTTAPSLPSPVAQMTRQHPVDGAIPHAQSRRISRQSGFGEYSSAASVESGSSHGGGTSGASHAQRARGRSVAGSTLSTSSSGSHHRNLRAPLGQQPPPAFGSNVLPVSNVLSASNSSPGMDSLLSHASSEHHWDKGLLSGARSSESLGALSAASGRSGGSSGSGKGAKRVLGGESIWTLGKEEEAAWPAAPPSSSGHSNQSKDMNQYTLRSLVAPVESLPASFEPVVVSKKQIQPILPEADYSYERALSSDLLDSYYPDHNPYSLAPVSDRSRVHQSIAQPRSAPALPVFEAEQLVRSRGEYREQTPQQNNPRYHEIYAHPQSRVQAATFAPEMRYQVDPRLAAQVSSRSLPMHAASDPSSRNVFDTRKNFDAGRVEAGSYSASTSRPSTARSALYVGPGAGDADQYARKSMMALPATGGVFPRYQEVAGPYAEASARPGSSGGRFKSLFKSRDSRVFK